MNEKFINIIGYVLLSALAVSVFIGISFLFYLIYFSFFV